MRARLLAAAAVSAALAFAPARAVASPSRIALVGADAKSELGVRLHAELEALGFEIVDVSAEGEAPSRARLDDAARGAQAAAAVRVVPYGRGYEVWIVDRVTGKTLLREVVEPEKAQRRDATVAVRAVELLRASLLEIHAKTPPKGEVPITPEAQALAGPAPSTLPSAEAPVKPATQRDDAPAFGVELSPRCS